MTATELAVKDLVEFGEYEFRVVAENEAGLGKPSDPSGRIVARNPHRKPGKVRDLEIKVGQIINIKYIKKPDKCSIFSYIFTMFFAHRIKARIQ